MPDAGLPVVPGTTETAADSTPLYQKLTDVLSARPGGSRTRLSEALTALEDAYTAESDSRMRGRIAAAQSVLTSGAGDDEDG